MTRKQMISTLRGMSFGTVIGSKGDEALRMAISALEQEPICIGKIEYDEDKLKEIVNDAVLTIQNQEPCEDAISREAVIKALVEWYGCEPNDLDIFKTMINELPSVQPICEEREKGECQWYAG